MALLSVAMAWAIAAARSGGFPRNTVIVVIAEA